MLIIQSFDVLSFTASYFAVLFLIPENCVIGGCLPAVLNLLFYPWDFVSMTRKFHALSESGDLYIDIDKRICIKTHSKIMQPALNNVAIVLG